MYLVYKQPLVWRLGMKNLKHTLGLVQPAICTRFIQPGQTWLSLYTHDATLTNHYYELASSIHLVSHKCYLFSDFHFCSIVNMVCIIYDCWGSINILQLPVINITTLVDLTCLGGMPVDFWTSEMLACAWTSSNISEVSNGSCWSHKKVEKHFTLL